MPGLSDPERLANMAERPLSPGPKPVDPRDQRSLLHDLHTHGPREASDNDGMAEALPAVYCEVLSSLPDSIIVVDGESRITYVNELAEELTGRSQPDLMGSRSRTCWRRTGADPTDRCELPTGATPRCARWDGSLTSA